MAETSFVRWEYSRAMSSLTDEQGWPSVQHEPYGGGQSGAQPLLHIAPYGFLGRPLDPAPGEDGDSCHALVAMIGNQGLILPTLDKRVLEKLPDREKGASIQYDSDGKFWLFDPKSDTATLYVPVEFDGGGTPTKAHSITVGKASDDTLLLSIVHADGMALVMQSDAKHSVVLKNKDGSATIVLDDEGITLAGKVRVAGGLVAGAAGAKPLVTLPELVAYLTTLEAAIASKQPAGPMPPPVATVAASFTATMVSST